MSTENGARHKQHQVDGTSPVVDIEELDKELRLRSRNRKMQRDREINNKENMKKSELKELLNSVSEGNVVKLCTCQQSKDFPYCDNTHSIFNKATNSNLSPLYVAFVEGKRGSKLKRSCSQTQDNSIAPESPGCSITLSDCTNTDSSILDTDPPTTTSSTSPSTSPTLTARRRSTLRKSTDTSTTCQCSTPTQTLTSSQTTNTTTTSSTSRNMDTTSRDSTNRDTTTSIDATSTTSSSVSRGEAVDITLPHSSDPEEDGDHNSNNTATTNDDNTKKEEKEGKDESKTITPPPVILTTPDATTTRDEESEEPTIATRKYIPSSIKDPRNRDNIISKYEVSQHNTQTDLWMIIKGNVYDITKYVKSHPGGVRALVKFAGKDGTENVQYHSSAMLEILNSHYYIGRLPKEEGGPGGGCIIC